MAEAHLNNLIVAPYREGQVSKWIRISAPPEVRDEQERRLSQEYTALTLVGAYCPEMVPIIYSGPHDQIRSIVMERLDTNVSVNAREVLGFIEKLQTIPVPLVDSQFPGSLTYYTPETYGQKIEERLTYLGGKGALKGMSAPEISKVRRGMLASADAILPFSTALVHTDIQARHFGLSAPDENGRQRLKLFDFDQAHFGNELEDFVWLSVRHPEFAQQIRTHLVAKFQGQPDKLEHLDQAMSFFSDYFYVKGVYDRVHQPRGGAFDKAAAVFGRLALASPGFRQTAQSMISHRK